MPERTTRRRPRRGGPLPLPEQPPLYAQNPLGAPLHVPAGWGRRPWRQWSRGGRIALAALLVTIALPLVLWAVLRLFGW